MSCRIHPGDRVFLVLLALIVGFFALSPFLFSEPAFQRMYAEDGVVETLSFYGWLVAAALILIRVRPIGFRAVSFAILSLAFAAREADWQKKFTSEGVLKINYYENAAHPLFERLIAGFIVLILVAGLLYAVYAAIRFLFFEKGWSERSGVWLFVTGVCLVIGKSLDRLPAELDNLFGITVSPSLVVHFQALEEGIEALAPLAFLWSIWVCAYGSGYLARRVKAPEESIS